MTPRGTGHDNPSLRACKNFRPHNLGLWVLVIFGGLVAYLHYVIKAGENG